MERMKIPTDAFYWGFKQIDGSALWLADRSEKSSLLFGPPRQGKATDILIPNLICNGGVNGEPGQSLVINDPKCELYAVCSKHMRAMGKTVYLINPFDLLPDYDEDKGDWI